MKALLTLLVILPILAIAQDTDSLFIRKISNEILTNGKAYDNLRHLTKKIGGRLAGSPQMVMAEKWGLTTMKEMGADTAYLQACMVPHWVRGAGDKATIISIDGKKMNRSLDILALGNSMGSGATGVSAEVLAVKSFDELEMHKDEVKGRIVFYDHPFNPTNIIPSKSYGETGVYRYMGASRAAKYGAVGVMIRSLTEAANNNPHTGVMRYNDSFPKIPALAMGLEDADTLWQMCSTHKVRVAFTTHGRFLPDTIGHNVIGELKGSDGTDEYITVGGHLDSWDVNEGASDDGTGVVQTMEILRALKTLGYQPKKNLRFVLFANEESAGRGGDKYAEEAKAKHEKHVFALESDDGGFTPRGFSIVAGRDTIAKIAAWKNLFVPYGGGMLEAGFSGADVEPLTAAMNTPAAGFVPDNQRYFDLHHSRGDVFEAVNKRELLLGAVNMTALIYLVDKYGF